MSLKILSDITKTLPAALSGLAPFTAADEGK